MDFKVFMRSVEQEIEKIKSESELREWIQDYARTIREEDRETFLKQFQKKERYTHEKERRTHAQELEEFIEWYESIEEEELMLTCEGHEDYDAEYWGGNDWIYDYEDPDGIIDNIVRFYEIAEQCVYDRDYETAHEILDALGRIRVAAMDEDIGEVGPELNLQDLTDEHLIKLNLKKITALTLYAAYQVLMPEERVESFYYYFSWNIFKDTKLEDMLSVGTEALEQVDEFMENWITYLRGQRDRYTARLLKEAVLFQYGEDGMLEEAKRSANEHPILFIQVLESFFESGSWERLLHEGKQALQLMNRDMIMRSQAARLTAAGARGMGKWEDEADAYFEAFYSKPSAENYLRLITCEKVTDKMKADALIRVKEVENDDNRRTSALSQELRGSVFQNTEWCTLDKKESLFISFYSQKFEKVLLVCSKEKEYLGWSGNILNTMVPLMLALLHRGEVLRPAALEGVTTANEVIYIEKYGEPDFITVFEMWKKQVNLPDNVEKAILEYLQKMIDGRVNAIVSGGHRSSYYKAARLGASLGEVEESLGMLEGKYRRIQQYFQLFPRHRAFKQEMAKYMEGKV